MQVVVSEENAAEISGAMTDITADETSIEPKTLGLSGDVVVKIVDVRTSDIKVSVSYQCPQLQVAPLLFDVMSCRISLVTLSLN